MNEFKRTLDMFHPFKISYDGMNYIVEHDEHCDIVKMFTNDGSQTVCLYFEKGTGKFRGFDNPYEEIH